MTAGRADERFAALATDLTAEKFSTKGTPMFEASRGPPDLLAVEGRSPLRGCVCHSAKTESAQCPISYAEHMAHNCTSEAECVGSHKFSYAI